MSFSDARECNSSLLESIDEAPSLRINTLRQLARDLDVERLDAPIVRRVVARFLDDAREAVPALVQAVAEGEWAEAAGNDFVEIAEGENRHEFHAEKA